MLLCLFLGGVSHAAAGGRLPGPAWLAGAFLVLAPAGVALARRRRHPVVLAGALGGAQCVVHLVLHHGAAGGGTGGGRHGVHAAGHMVSAGMALGHTLAALGALACLVYGELLLRQLADLVVPSVFFRRPPLPLPVLRLVPRGPVVRTARFGVVLARALWRRGPPPEAVPA
ncbi:hypothetical protein [Streptomyces sp. JJ36]|uniref:hypothetical protein n=1 Tax=Streptomyces sp. JJ36 TaxID=2736645 RepID=UPI001F26B93B|nr:hypothetical protein [Streptomyces sp. JJ36]MCF6524545.1 hypothetical protein [Streptomyces sp. JJ36]